VAIDIYLNQPYAISSMANDELDKSILSSIEEYKENLKIKTRELFKWEEELKKREISLTKKEERLKESMEGLNNDLKSFISSKKKS
jgi:hypothetical protein